jgi:hypothetical protein
VVEDERRFSTTKETDSLPGQIAGPVSLTAEFEDFHRHRPNADLFRATGIQRREELQA